MTTTLSDQDIRHFRRHGWVRVPGLHDRAQLQVLQATMARGFADPPNLNHTYGKPVSAAPRDVVSNEDAQVVLMNVRELNRYYPEARPVCMDRNVGAVVRALLGSARVRLFSETYLDKPPGSLATPWHQDWPLQPFDRRDTVNCWVAIDDISLEQGPLQVVSGSHRLGPIYTPTDFSEQPELSELLTREDTELLWSLATPADIEDQGAPVHRAAFTAGEAIIFYGSVLHGARTNLTQRARRSYTRSIISADVRYTGMPYLKTDAVGLTVGNTFDLARYPIYL